MSSCANSCHAGPQHTSQSAKIYSQRGSLYYWQTRFKQVEKQRKAGGSDQGLRGAVTGGAQMNGFIELLTKLVIEAGIDPRRF